MAAFLTTLKTDPCLPPEGGLIRAADFQARANGEEILTRAREEAKAIIRNAQEEAGSIRRDVREQASAEWSDQVAAGLSGFRQTMEDYRAGAEARLPGLVLHLVRQVMETIPVEEQVLAGIRQAVNRELAGQTPVVFAHPDLCPVLSRQTPLTVKPDPALPRTGLRLEGSETIVDAGVETRLKNLHNLCRN